MLILRVLPLKPHWQLPALTRELTANNEGEIIRKYNFQNVVFTSIATSGSGGGDKMTENVSFKIGKVTDTVFSYDCQGKQTSKPFCWDAIQKVKDNFLSEYITIQYVMVLDFFHSNYVITLPLKVAVA
jgi:hypothetical protein